MTPTDYAIVLKSDDYEQDPHSREARVSIAVFDLMRHRRLPE
jgi:hypothetical protein